MSVGKALDELSITYLSSVDNEFYKLERRSRHPEWWIDGHAGDLAPFKQILLLERVLKIISPSRFGTRKGLVRRWYHLAGVAGVLPDKKVSGFKKVSWDEGTFLNFLYEKASPSKEGIRQLLNILIRMTDEEFFLGHGVRTGGDGWLKELLSRPWAAPSQFLIDLLQDAQLSEAGSVAQTEAPEPPPGPGPQYGLRGGKLAETLSPPNEHEAEKQAALHQRLRSAAAALAGALGPSSNRYPALASAAHEYAQLLAVITKEIDVTGVWSVGGALANFATSYQQQNIARTLAEPLEPQIEAQLLSVVRQHGAFILGFEEGRQLVELADEFALDIARLREIENPGSALLNELTENRELVEDRTRELHRPVRDGVFEFGWTTSRASYAAYVIVRNSVHAMIKYAVSDKPDMAKVGGAIGLLAAASGRTNPEFVQAAIPVLQRYATELMAFFNNFPEMRAYVDWALHILEVDIEDSGK